MRKLLRTLTCGFAISAAAVLPSATPAMAQDAAGQYAQQFVTSCLTALVGPGDHATRVKSAGFDGRRKKIERGIFIFAPKKDGGLCHMSFGSVFPNPHLQMEAIKAELSRQGYKDTGKDIAPAAGKNPLAGTGATSRRVLTKGGAAVTLELAGGVNTSPVYALQVLPQ